MDYHLTERGYLLSPHKQTIVNQLLYATTLFPNLPERN